MLEKTNEEIYCYFLSVRDPNLSAKRGNYSTMMFLVCWKSSRGFNTKTQTTKVGFCMDFG